MARHKRISTAQPVLLSIADVALMLGVCRQTVYNYIYKECLPSVKVRGMRRVRPDALSRWIEAHEQEFA